MDVDLTSKAYKSNPLPMLRALGEAGPLVDAKLPLVGHTTLVTTWDACVEVLKSSERFCVDARNAGRGRFDFFRFPLPRTIRVLAENMLGHDDPDHRRLRDLVERAFRRSRVDELHPRIERAADELLDELEPDLQAGRDVDLLERFARRLPLIVITDMLGLEEGDREKFWRWVHPLTSDPNALRIVLGMRGLRKLMRYLEGEFEKRRHAPGEGLITALVQEAAEGEMSSEELVSMVFLLLVAGHETTTHLLAGGALELLRRPEERALLAKDWSGVSTAVDELLRYVSPVQSTKPRFARGDDEVGGVRVRKGQMLLPLLAAANLDPARFDEPERLDLARSPNPHLGFGSGAHSCLGIQLAKAEGAIAFERLFSRAPRLELAVSDASLDYTGRFGIRALRGLPVRLAR